MLRKAFGEHSLNLTAVFQWHSHFKAGWVSVEDDEHSGRPSTNKTIENVKKFENSIHEDRCQIIHELADTVGISYGVYQKILTENLNMRRFSTKFVPTLLTSDQKQWHINTCLELWEKANNDKNFISRIITGDESWILFPKSKMKLKGWSFETVSDIQRESQAVLDSIKENDFCGAFEAWKRWWDRCIHSLGDYFEGDNSQN
jgi:hypothetical protein